MWIFQFDSETNEANFSAATFITDLENQFDHFRDVCDWTWYLYVVNDVYQFEFKCSSINLIEMIQFRFPDFLLQLLNYDGAPKTLCEIVVPNSAVNSTSEAYVELN